jgi:O-antigen/teichoic acid export membrane protein
VSERPPEDLSGTVVRGAGLSSLGFVMTQVLALGFYLALARLATPDDFGEFAAAAIIINTGLLFTESGMLAALIHRRDRVDEAASTAVVSTALGGLLFSLLALAASPLIALIFDSDRIGSLSAALAGILFVRSLQVVPEALLQRRFSFLRRMVIEPVQMAAFGVAAVIATSEGLGPWGLVIGYYASAVTDVALSWALVRWRPRLRQASYALWRELIAYGREVLASNLILRAGEQVPVVLIGRYIGQNPLGQYRYAHRLADTPLALIVQSGSYVVLPAFARISTDRTRFKAAFLRSLRWFGVLAFPIGLILIPLGVPLAVVLFGEVWRSAGEAAMALSAYTIGASVVSVCSEAYKAEGRPRELIRVHTVSMVCATIAAIALLPYDLVGVCIGLSLGLLVGAAYALARVGSMIEIPLRTLLAQLWAPAVAGALMVAVTLPLDRLVVQPLDHSTAVALLLIAAEGLLAVAIYAGTVAVLARDTIGQGREMLAAIRRRGPAEASAEDEPLLPDQSPGGG